MQECDNCGRTIGKLEKPCMFDNNIVCAGCERILREQRQVKIKQPASTPVRTVANDEKANLRKATDTVVGRVVFWVLVAFLVMILWTVLTTV